MISRRLGSDFGLFFLLFSVASGACVFLLLTFPPLEVRNDAVEYLSIARNIAVGNGFTFDGVNPYFYRPPLFSILLGTWFFMTGTDSAFSAGVFQSLVHGATAVLAGLLFLELGASRLMSFFGGALVAVHPVLVTRVAFVLQEPTLMLATTAAVLLSVRLVKASSSVRAAAAGIAWGLCSLGKVVTLFAPFLLLGMRFLPGCRAWKWKGAEAAMLLLCFVGAIAPWTIRNAVHLHRLVLVNDQGRGMLEWNVLQAEPEGSVSGKEFLGTLDVRGIGGKERFDAVSAYVAENPWHFVVRRTVVNALQFASWARDWWNEQGYAFIRKESPWFWAIALALQGPLYCALGFRAVSLFRGSIPAASGFTILFYLVYWVQYAVLWGEPRFAIPVYPLLIWFLLSVKEGPSRGNGGLCWGETSPGGLQ